MPMIWNAEADAKLLNAIIKVYDVKVSGEKMKEVAEIMGTECTPKAVTHRLAKLRSMQNESGGGLGGEGEGETGVKDGTATPKAKGAKGKKAAGGPKPKGKKGKGADERTPSPASGSEGAEGMVTPPDTTTKKRAGSKRKSASAEDDGEKEGKKIKVEEDTCETEIEEGEITA